MCQLAKHRLACGAVIVLGWAIGSALPVIGDDDSDFAVIDVIFNVLKGVKEEDVTDEKIDAGIKEANKLLKQAKVKIQRKGDVNRDVSDEGNDDGETTAAEREKLRAKGQKETDDKVGKGKGYKIYIANDCDTSDALTLAMTAHNIAVTVTEVEEKDEDFGNTLAHEICHALTLGKNHDVDKKDDSKADDTGHVDDPDNLMDDDEKGTELGEAQKDEVKKTADGRATTKTKTAESEAPAPKEHKKAETIDPKSGEDGEQSGIPPHNDLRESQCLIPGQGALASGAFQLQGMFDHNGLVQSQFYMLIDADNNTQTGAPVVVDGTLLGADGIVEIQVFGDMEHPLEASGRYLDVQGGQTYPLNSVHVVTQHEFGCDRAPGDGAYATPLLDEIEFTLDPALLPPLQAPLTIGVRSFDPISNTADEALMSLLDHPLPGPHPALTLSEYAVEAGGTTQAFGINFAPNSVVHIFLDDTVTATTTTDDTGAFVSDFTTPSDPFSEGFLWVTGTDAAGGSDFSVLHQLVAGACCFEGGSCALHYLVACDELGGTYLGDNVVCPLGNACIPHVDNTATGANNGWRWSDAFPDLQSALDIARANPDITEIWVADGVYKPDSASGERPRSFALVEGVAVYGGFAGSEESRDQRDPQTNRTVLSGDLSSDDGPHFENRGDNSYHIVTATNIGSAAILDGCWITGGNADGDSDGETYFDDAGGGMRLDHAGPTIRNCTFHDNRAKFGGGVESFFGTASFFDVTFEANLSLNEGGGLHNNRSTLTMERATFVRNVAGGLGGGCRFVRGDGTYSNSMFESNSASSGGAMLIDNQSVPLFFNTVLRSNHADHDGGAILIDRGSAPVLAGLLADGNRAGERGGFVHVRDAATSPAIINGTLVANRAATDGGVSQEDGETSLANCVLYYNEDDGGMTESSQLNQSGGSFSVSHCNVQDWSGSYGGTGNFGAEPRLVDPPHWDGEVFFPGDPHPRDDSPVRDTGDSGAVPPGLDEDLDGLDRVIDGVVDVGGYELRRRPGIPGDANCDGVIDFNDIDCFVAALIGIESWVNCGGRQGCDYIYVNDVNGDGKVDFNDIDAFVECLINGGCP